MATFKYTSPSVVSSVDRKADGSLVVTKRDFFTEDFFPRSMQFRNLDDWLACTMNEQLDRPRKHSFSFIPADPTKLSTVAWVASNCHYIEVRRGTETGFAKRTWNNVKDWLADVDVGAIAEPAAAADGLQAWIDACPDQEVKNAVATFLAKAV